MSVLEKAHLLTVRARTYSEEASARDERTRIGNALGEVKRELAVLDVAAAAYRAARDMGVPVPDVTAPTELVAVREGLPSQQALVAARKRVVKLAADAREAVGAAWREWSQGKVAAANLGRISRLEIQHRRRGEDLQKRLRTMAAAKDVTAAQINAFCQDLSQLEGMLATIRDDDPLVLLLNRIRKGQMTLADLTDDEIDALRSDITVASQVILRAT